MMLEVSHRLWIDRRAAAAVEMALVTPLLIILMFGAMELGKYFLDQHMVVEAVRDGARFAARQDFDSMPCAGTAGNETQIKNLVRTGTTDGTGTPRIFYWTNNSTITVSIDCYANTGGGGTTTIYSGVYEGKTTVPQVTVAASVPYVPLLGAIGFETSGLFLNASNQAAVAGI